jgi:transposase
VIAEPLALPIERGLAGPGLLAWVLVSKFCDHMPLHRLEGILDRYGAPIARSTLCGWVEAMHGLCAPLEQAMWQDALKSDYIAVDATGVLVQAKEQCKPLTDRPAVASAGRVRTVGGCSSRPSFYRA